MSTPSEAPTGPYTGRFSDGKTASGAPAAVRLAVQGIEMVPDGGQSLVLWPYSELAAASPVSRKAGDVLLTHAAVPGATLFVADPAFVSALVAKAPHLTAASQRWRYARPMLAICAAIA